MIHELNPCRGTGCSPTSLWPWRLGSGRAAVWCSLAWYGGLCTEKAAGVRVGETEGRAGRQEAQYLDPHEQQKAPNRKSNEVSFRASNLSHFNSVLMNQLTSPSSPTRIGFSSTRHRHQNLQSYYKNNEGKKWNSCSCFISLMKCNYNVRKCVGTWTQSYICNTIYKIDQILFLSTANNRNRNCFIVLTVALYNKISILL